MEKREAPAFDEDAAAEKMAAKLAADVTIEQTCFNCGRSENDAVLFPARTQGREHLGLRQVPARAHPRLIGASRVSAPAPDGAPGA